MKKPFKETKVGGLLRGLLREGLQTLPVVGTIVTNFKTDDKNNPKGKVSLSKWDVYRLILGIGIAYLLYRGALTMDQIQFIFCTFI